MAVRCKKSEPGRKERYHSGEIPLIAKVGQGGMGSVYKALHLAFDEMRALKVIAPELLSDELVREAV
jgi:serine/threonine protein kinase